MPLDRVVPAVHLHLERVCWLTRNCLGIGSRLVVQVWAERGPPDKARTTPALVATASVVVIAAMVIILQTNTHLYTSAVDAIFRPSIHVDPTLALV
jgi:hypothetical protein